VRKSKIELIGPMNSMKSRITRMSNAEDAEEEPATAGAGLLEAGARSRMGFHRSSDGLRHPPGLLKNGLVQRTSDSGLETAADEREG
jgi:hypothetical protein